ncbi:hypothetical protein BN7_5089 [Wickerhamomyces ciferrii]|uniref:Uncharacterized protein n=1 Tax=Wickerhamomyces ciferrii (strain ATCC 14091 / BCRC 22168 / CBS 111 / JCM 3599 / NBRC 0793 / NRRL Y-1031 F-60-10) TaxID=1206466 RepID=K0KU07_WICCF|nr:uncharacterized protein BN7_5089 [Wickerhamomyces ciferrii]CCH45507.1 hypothetical protein BN7_5089 [Wickerhamomyces ciferrii]
MNQIREFTTSATRNYRAYRAPRFWDYSTKQTFGKHLNLNSMRSWGRHYHGAPYGPWGHRFNRGFHHHRRGGIFGYLLVGGIGYWFGYHANPDRWDQRHKEKLERWSRNRDEWWNTRWENHPKQTETRNEESIIPTHESKNSSSSYGLWKS